MPGKGNFDQDDAQGQYFPGSKEYRAWDEGYVRRYVEGAASKANTVHASGTAEFDADQAGWDRANNFGGDGHMPWPGRTPV